MDASAGSSFLIRASPLQKPSKNVEAELCFHPLSSFVPLCTPTYGLRSSDFYISVETSSRNICWLALRNPIRNFACSYHHLHRLSQVYPLRRKSIGFSATCELPVKSTGRDSFRGTKGKESRGRYQNTVTCYATGQEDDHENGKSTSVATEEPEDAEPKASSLPAEQQAERDRLPEPSNVQMDAFKLLDLLGPEKVDPEDVKLLKEKVFGYSTFWVTGQEPFGDLGAGILFLGNLRGKREEVFAKLQRQLREVTGSKYNLFMVEEPNSEGPDPRGGPRVSFVLLRKEASEPKDTTLWQFVIAFVLFVITAGSCLELGIASQLSKLPPEVVRYFTNPEVGEPPDLNTLVPYVEAAMPLTYGVLGVQLFHEVGHFLAAARKKVKMGIPYFIPNITLGSFGAITQFRSILPDRMAKFDISLAGPLAGGLLSLAMLGVGLLLSTSPEAASDLVQVPSMLFQGSLLLGYLSRTVLGYKCGLTTTAFNLLPVGCLDGGRAMQAAFGKSALTGFALGTYLLLGLGVLGGPLSLPWGLYILICQRDPEKPCLNDVTEVGSFRQGVFAVTLIFVVLTLLPLWDGLADDLGIGLGSPLI
ncbi:hypothetical protein KP509_08G062200 [Ceratopteris richardii]|uniref:Peptidase M50 domain-containing protein n=1 Tax=Ceratopteris richardii TaxID=49495 RepID=A0A8T2U7B0_CERRI|nr:hypothetical protein KP509_08G062200 [Ceratopteris richardii]